MKCLKEFSELLVSIWMFCKSLINFILTFVRIREEVPQFKKEKEISDRDFFDWIGIKSTCYLNAWLEVFRDWLVKTACILRLSTFVCSLCNIPAQTPGPQNQSLRIWEALKAFWALCLAPQKTTAVEVAFSFTTNLSSIFCSLGHVQLTCL